ncbi:MAG: phosphopantothenoylcysteine decarboxylase [Planctomycetota bacterium]|jgi:phosphopantothenoylcysteine decarboxylase/phosphopantothenate--cysteine ligase|nr:phosphopantothenoylcysteine decarboxylase [Planctomycetota bacterium]
MTRVLITGGATCEDIDSVRFITNRSTGKMGVALAQAARRAGYETRLLLGDTAVISGRLASAMQLTRFRSTADLLAKIEANFDWCDWLIMSAAVADYTPATTLPTKRRKAADDWTLTLKRTTDILRHLAGHPSRAQKLVCGFSLTDELDLATGREKLSAKGLDLLVANGAATLGSATVTAALLAPARPPQMFANLTKPQLSRAILARLAEIAGKKGI